MDTTSTWNTAASADWNSPADWSNGVPDELTTDATIAASGAYTVLISNGESFSVGSVELNGAAATLEIGGTLALGGTADTLALAAGTLQLNSGGVIASGTIVNSGGALLASGGTLDGVTYQGVLTLAGSQQSLFIENGLTLQTAAGGQPGSIDLSGASASVISVLDSGTLDNATLTFDFAGQTDALITGTGSDSGHTLTLGSSFTIDVSAGNNNLGHYAQTYFADDAGDTLDNDGLINISSGVLNNYYGTLNNTGSISIDGGGFTLQNGATLNNTGNISISNGSELYLQGPLTTRQLGDISVTGGAALLFGGLLDNTGSTLDIGAGSALGTLDLTSGDTILGGTVLDSGSGLLASGGTLDGVTYRGVLTLSGYDPYLFIENGLTLETASGGKPGSIDLSGATLGAISVLDSETLNNATLNFGAADVEDSLSSGTGYDSGHTLTLGGGFTVEVGGGTDYLGFYAYAYFVNDAADRLDNAGLIDVSGGQLTVEYGNFNNTGSINLDGGVLGIQSGTTFDNTGHINISDSGVLNLQGASALTTVQLGDISVSSGGTLEFTGLLDNTGATLDIGTGSALGTLNLSSGDTIKAGTIIDSGSGLAMNGGTLDDVTYRGVLTLSGYFPYLYVEGGLKLETASGGEPGSIDLSGASLGAISVLDNETLNNATLNFGTGAEDSLISGTGNDSGHTLTLGGGFTVEVSGGTGYLGFYAYSFYANDAADTLDNAGLIDVTGGQLTVEYGRFNNTGSISVDGGGFSLQNGATLNNTGNISISNGSALDLQTKVTGTGGFTIDAGAELEFATSPSSGQLIKFNGLGSTLKIDTPASFSGTIGSFSPGNTIDLAGITTATGAQINGTTLTVSLSGGGSLNYTVIAPAPGETLMTDGDNNNGTDITAMICFLPGTRVATPAGEVPIEALAIGDYVRTLSGAARPIRWIGKGRVLATRGRRNAATPVIVRKGALAANVPNADLRVTKAHALYVDGVLIPVEFLVNHRSILWDDHAQEVSVYHIELDTHDVLLANGAPAESYRDDRNRWLFQNANSGWGLPPQEPCAPVLTGGPVVDAVWRRLLERAGPRHNPPTTDDPDLHLLVDGQRVDATSRSPTQHVFHLASRPTAVRIISRTGSPQELGLARDPRCLGVPLRRITVTQEMRVRTIQAQDPVLADGFHGYEADNRVNWTNGDAAMQAAVFDGCDGPVRLAICLGGTTRYVDHGANTPLAQTRQAA